LGAQRSGGLNPSPLLNGCYPETPGLLTGLTTMQSRRHHRNRPAVRPRATVIVSPEAVLRAGAAREYNPGMSSGDGTGMPSRAASRRTWSVRLVALGSEPPDDVDRSTTPEERLAMVWSLTVEAWAVSGRPMPTYPRTGTPVRLCRLDGRRPETPA
jgi:hypothetical protein